MADINSPDYILYEDNPANYPASALAFVPARCHSCETFVDLFTGEEYTYCPEFVQSVTQHECDAYNEIQRRLAMSILRGTMSTCWKLN